MKTFLRTYAQFLGLDPHLLVEEYSARFEEPEELEVAGVHAQAPAAGAHAPHGAADPRDRRRAPGAGIPGLPARARADGRRRQRRAGARHRARRSAQAPPPRQTGRRSRSRRAARRASVRLEVVAARPVWVCVVDDADRERVGGVVLGAGEREGPFRSRSFRVTVGNGGGDLRIDGAAATPRTAQSRSAIACGRPGSPCCPRTAGRPVAETADRPRRTGGDGARGARRPCAGSQRAVARRPPGRARRRAGARADHRRPAAPTCARRWSSCAPRART